MNKIHGVRWQADGKQPKLFDAQLTYRESLRDIEACLRAQQKKLYHMGIRERISGSTLAEANVKCDWRIYADLAQRLICTARQLYINDDFGVELDETVYALDSTTIDLSLSMFPWASFRQTKAAIKLNTLLDLRGSIPTFIHVSDGKFHDINYEYRFIFCLQKHKKDPNSLSFEKIDISVRQRKRFCNANFH